jgi:hypothetical protein
MTLGPVKTPWRIALAALFTLATWTLPAAEPTAFALLKDGNRHVAEEVKDKVLQIRSGKSAEGLTPTIWFILYYDVHARTRETELTFENGRMQKSRHPFRLFARAGASSNILDNAKLKIDSDVALSTSEKDPLLEKLKLTHSQMTLEQWEDGVVWKITFWAEKTRESGKTAEIGKIFVNAEDGKVVHRDLHLERVK